MSHCEHARRALLVLWVRCAGLFVAGGLGARLTVARLVFFESKTIHPGTARA